MRLVYLALGWVSGIILVESGVSHSPVLWVPLVILAGFSAWLGWPSRWRWGYLALVAFTLGGLRAAFLPVTSPLASLNGLGGMTLEGVVVAEPDVRDNIALLRLDVETVTRTGQTQSISGMALVRVPRSTQAAYGDRIRATGQLIEPGVYDTFSYSDYLARQGIFSILDNVAVEFVSSGHGNPFTALLLRLKAHAAEQINRSMPEPQAGLLVGILLGNERGLSPALQEDFARTGAAHIVAISGFNMVILAGFVTMLLEKTPLPRPLVALIAVTVLAVYTAFVGANAAVVRAALMSSVLVIGGALKRRTYVPASLAFVALVLSALNPRVLWDVSFQLSFFATLGLALFADPLTRAFERGLRRLLPDGVANALSGFLSEPLIVTIAALVTTLPLTALYFNRLSLVQLPVNLLVVPVQSAVLLSGILATLSAPILPAFAQVVYWFDMALLSWTVMVVRAFSALPFAEISFYIDSQWVIFFFVMVIGGAVLQASQPTWALRLAQFIRLRTVFSTVMMLGLVMGGLNLVLFRARPDGMLHVYMLDVGHSNGVLIVSPGGAQILVDGGRFPSRLLTQIGDRIPFNDREIELLIITQPEEFQYGALPAVLDRYSVGAALTNGWTKISAISGQDEDGTPVNLSAAFEQLQSALVGTNIVPAVAGYSVTLDDGTLLEVLHPQEPFMFGESLDDNALVFRVTYGGVSFLFTSDLSIGGQQVLMDAGVYLGAAVIQLPQHGAARSLSEEFLAAVQPQVVLLQSDPANRRGDPDPDTLTLLNADWPLFRTDEQGVIHLWTDGVTLLVE